MCTVSYIPNSEDTFILTSNRDERSNRITRPPSAATIGNVTVFFPKDEEAGGTWIAAGDNGRICCLLNGAFKKHKRKPFYVKSRGKLLLETFEYENIYDFFQNSSLHDIEAFTLIVSDVIETQKLFEFRWNEKKKYLKEIDAYAPHIWSSATLYNENTRKLRAKWFKKWLENKIDINKENIMEFHSFPHSNDPKNDLIMEREGGLKTVSITQIEFNKDSFNMHYHDLLKEKKSSLIKGIKQNCYV